MRKTRIYNAALSEMFYSCVEVHLSYHDRPEGTFMGFLAPNDRAASRVMNC